jgi:hypothetical protein
MHMVAMVSPPAEDEVKLVPSPNGTLPRSLDGIAVSATVLDELFAMYVHPVWFIQTLTRQLFPKFQSISAVFGSKPQPQ